MTTSFEFFIFIRKNISALSIELTYFSRNGLLNDLWLTFIKKRLFPKKTQAFSKKIKNSFIQYFKKFTVLIEMIIE